MKKKNLSVKEVMNNKKNQEYLNKKFNKDGIVQYYVLDEKQRITIADVEYNKEIDDIMRENDRIVPEGEVLLIQEDTRKFWVSTSKKSLIDVMNNRKHDIYSMRVYHQKAAPSMDMQYYLLFDVSVSKANAEQNERFKKLLYNCPFPAEENMLICNEEPAVMVKKLKPYPKDAFIEGEVFLLSDAFLYFSYYVSTNKEVLVQFAENRKLKKKYTEFD